MRAGVREVLLSRAARLPVPGAGAHRGKLQRRGQTSGKVLAFISCKGGSGATFLATNLAYALAASGDSRWR
jgi:pilus assembly protein CpaE